MKIQEEPLLKAIPVFQIWSMIKPYWVSEERFFANSFFAFVIGLNLLYIYLNVLMAKWSGRFFDALQKLDQEVFFRELYYFFNVVLALVFVYVAKSFSGSYLAFRWRRWLTILYQTKWLANKSYYLMMHLEKPIDNPDQRIQEDLDRFASLTLDLFLVMLSSAVTLVTFTVLLWNLAGVFRFSLFGEEYQIKGVLMYGVLVYCFVTTLVIILIGAPYVRLTFLQQRVEANYRYRLIRIREKREEIATFSGELYENENLDLSFKDIVSNYYKILLRTIYINTWQNLSINGATLMPYFIMGPDLFAGVITLGVLFEAARAFGQVENSLNVIVTSYFAFGNWKATANRLNEFFATISIIEDLKESEISSKIEIKKTGSELVIANVSLYTPYGRKILENVNFRVKPREKLAIVGKSGIGKTTLFRTISSIWPFATGSIILPENAKIFYLSQRPYMPIGTLLQVLSYPSKQEGLYERSEIIRYLQIFGLNSLVNRLDEYDDWSIALSMGEQQRVSFIRAMLYKPTWLFMDEPTASVDRDNEQLLFNLISEELPEASVIVISHSGATIQQMNRVVDLKEWAKA